NDAFAGAQELTGASGQVTGSNVNATEESGEPNHAGIQGGRSVWYVWTAPAEGSVSFDTFGSSFDTILAVYTGSSLSGLVSVAADDDAGGGVQSKVSFTASAGTTYRIAVDGWTGGAPASGDVTLNWPQQARRPPANDAFAPAQ